MSSKDIEKLFYFMTYRNFWRYAPKKWSFHLFWAHFGHFGPSAHRYGPSAPKKKLHMTFKDMLKLFNFMTFIPKLHILATRGQKSGFFLPFLGKWWAFGPPLWAFGPILL